jgi:hypothetical protein
VTRSDVESWGRVSTVNGPPTRSALVRRKSSGSLSHRCRTRDLRALSARRVNTVTPHPEHELCGRLGAPTTLSAPGGRKHRLIAVKTSRRATQHAWRCWREADLASRLMVSLGRRRVTDEPGRELETATAQQQMRLGQRQVLGQQSAISSHCPGITSHAAAGDPAPLTRTSTSPRRRQNSNL